MMSGLTVEQKRRIDENRRKALELRAARQNPNLPKQQNNLVSASGSGTSTCQGSHNFHTSLQGAHNPSRHEVCKPSTSVNISGRSNHSNALGLKPLISKNGSGTVSSASGHPNRFGPTIGQHTTSRPTNPVASFAKAGSSHNQFKPLTSGASFYGSSNKNKPLVTRPGNISIGLPNNMGHKQVCHRDRIVDNPPARTTAGSGVSKAQFALLSRTRFEVQVGFNQQLIETFKSMETKQYVSEVKACNGIQAVALPGPVLCTFRDQIQGAPPIDNQPPDADITHVDPILVDALMPFQKGGVNFAIQKRGRVLIADDMGLGKTIQALCVACYYREEWPLLIVVPSSVRFAWREQILRWVPSLDPQEISVITSTKTHVSSGLVTIISYDLLVRSKKVQDRYFGVIIMDESHSLKNPKTARTKAAVPMLKKTKRVILLSGTPALSRPSELYTQISCIDYKTFPSFQAFGQRYCDGKPSQWGWDFSGSSHMQELQIVLRENIMIRRLKKDVLQQLPTKQRGMVLLDPSSIVTSKVMKASHTLVEKLKGNERRGALLEYFHETATSKASAVKEYVLDLLEGEHKFLFFGHHQEMLDIIETAVKKKKYEYIRIDGRTSAEKRNTLCDKFQEEDDVKIAILSIMAANAGLNFTAASLVVFGELFWNPGILVQAEDRVHRIGQEDSVSIQYLVATGTADDYIWPLVQRKLDVLGKAGLTKDDFSSADTKQQKNKNDIMQYFEESFFEDDELLAAVASESPISEKQPKGITSAFQQSAVPTKRQGSLFQYISSTSKKVDPKSTDIKKSDDIDWDEEPFFTEDWESEICDNPVPKRSRMDNCVS